MFRKKNLTTLTLVVLASFLLAVFLVPGVKSSLLGKGPGFAWAQGVEITETSVYHGAVAGQVKGEGVADAAYGVSGALVGVWRAEGTVNVPAGKEDTPGSQAVVFPPRLAGQFTRWTAADSSGYYRINDLPPGVYYLAATAGQEAAAWFKPAFAGMIKISAGEVTKKDLTLQGPYGALGGRVTGLAGNGIPGATVLALPKAAPGATARLEAGAEITTEADGTITVRQNGLNIKLEAAVRGESTGRFNLKQEQVGLLTRVAHYKTTTDAAGYYFIPFVEPGAYWVVAIKGNTYACREAKVEVRQLTRVDLQFSLPAVIVQPVEPGQPSEKPVKIKVFIRGRLLETDVAPVLEGDRVLVPLRALVEALGAEVTWDVNGMIKIKKDKAMVKLQINSKAAHQNGRGIQLDTPARIHKERTMVPVRFLSQAFGAKVKWDAGAGSVFIE